MSDLELSVATKTAAPAALSGGERVLQRKCDCGNHTGGGTCGPCKSKQDSGAGRTWQRSAIGAHSVDEVPPIVHEVLRSPGQSLDAATRNFFEPRLGTDFSRVRVHTHSNLSDSAKPMDRKNSNGANLTFGDPRRCLPLTAGTHNHYLGNSGSHEAVGKKDFAKGGKDEEMSKLPERDDEDLLADEMPEHHFAESAGIQIGAPGAVQTSVVEEKKGSVELDDDYGDSGLTSPESINETIRAIKIGTRWKAELTDLVGHYSKQARLLPGVKEVTGPEGNTTSSNFCAQAEDLYSLGDRGTKWYMLSAVIAHEDVHAAHMGPALAQAAPKIKAAFGRVKVKDDTQKSEATALTEIQVQPRYQKIRKKIVDLWIRKASRFTKADHRGPAYAAEFKAVTPMIESICNHARQNKWGPCKRCHP